MYLLLVDPGNPSGRVWECAQMRKVHLEVDTMFTVQRGVGGAEKF